MGLFVNKLKLRAAAGSMQQFTCKVNDIFPEEVGSEVVEATTTFLYLQMADEILGRRFASRLAGCLIERVAISPEELKKRVIQLSANVENRGRHEEFHVYITRLVGCLLQEAGCPSDDPEVLRDCFIRFQEAVSPMKEHFEGIKNQNTWVLRRAA